MICPDCLEDYNFIKFDVDADSLEHRGIFSCECPELIMFPEFITREIIEDLDLMEQLRTSKIMHMMRYAKDNTPSPRLITQKAIKVHTRHLERYLKDVSEQSIRTLK